MRSGFREQFFETAIIAALGGGSADLEQRFHLGAAHRQMIDVSCGQDARAPGGIISIERAGKMDTALGGWPLTGNDTVAHHGKGLCCGLVAGDIGRVEGADRFGKGSKRGGHR